MCQFGSFDDSLFVHRPLASFAEPRMSHFHAGPGEVTNHARDITTGGSYFGMFQTEPGVIPPPLRAFFR